MPQPRSAFSPDPSRSARGDGCLPGSTCLSRNLSHIENRAWQLPNSGHGKLPKSVREPRGGGIAASEHSERNAESLLPQFQPPVQCRGAGGIGRDADVHGSHRVAVALGKALVSTGTGVNFQRASAKYIICVACSWHGFHRAQAGRARCTSGPRSSGTRMVSLMSNWPSKATCPESRAAHLRLWQIGNSSEGRTGGG